MIERVPPLESARCREVLSYLEGVRDIIDERVARPEAPGWARARGWDGFLLALDDETVEACERAGLALSLPGLPGVPESLARLATAAADLTEVPRMAALRESFDTVPSRPARELYVSPRKLVQIRELIEALGGLGGKVDRVVDVGSGVGHLTRRASAALDVPALGLELEDHLVERARLLALEGSPIERSSDSTQVHFERHDAFARSLDLEPRTLAIGLHACGALADTLVVEAARAHCPVALVACCHQKYPKGHREPLSALGRQHGLSHAAKVLGLANSHPRAERLGAGVDRAFDARTSRYALCLLLEARGISVDPERTLRPPKGHRTFRGYTALVAAEFARRDFDPPEEEEVREAFERARADRSTIRRLSLPRNLLARPLEIGLAADRAAFLRERGYTPRLVEVFSDEASPRNLLLVGEP